MNHKTLALLTALAIAAATTPALAGGYVNYTCTVDGYSFGIKRHGGLVATLRDATGAHMAVHRKAVALGERYLGRDAKGQQVDVWMKDKDATITVASSARHSSCTIARFATAGAVNYICATGYSFSTHVGGGGRLDYIDGYGNIASLVLSEAPGHVRYTGTAVTGMTIDLSLANNQASLTTNRGSNGLQCQVR